MGPLVIDAATHQPPRQLRFRLWSDEELENVPTPAWLVDEVLQRETLAVLYGARESGKTFVALDLALSVASGLAWHGRAVTEGQVLYVLAEGSAGIAKRTLAWKTRRGVTRSLPIRFLRSSLQLQKPTEMKDVLDSVRGQVQGPVSLVILDTLARCFVGGDENTAKDMGLLLDNAASIGRELGAPNVLLLHHVGKHSDSERGSSSLGANADTMIEAVRKGDDVTLKCRKQREAPHFKPITLRLAPFADSCVLEHAEQDITSTSLSPTLRNCLRALAAFGKSGTTASEWQRASGLPESSFYRAERRLLDESLVSREGKGFRLSDDGRRLSLSRDSQSTLSESTLITPTPP